MLKLSEAQVARHEHDARQAFAGRLREWLLAHGELADAAPRLTLPWCRQSLDLARADGIAMECDVGDFARLRALRGDDWLRADAAREILGSDRDGELKVFQLDCLHEGVRDGQ